MTEELTLEKAIEICDAAVMEALKEGPLDAESAVRIAVSTLFVEMDRRFEATPQLQLNVEREGNTVIITAEEVAMILAFRKRGKDRRKIQLPFLMHDDRRKYQGDRRSK